MGQRPIRGVKQATRHTRATIHIPFPTWLTVEKPAHAGSVFLGHAHPDAHERRFRGPHVDDTRTRERHPVRGRARPSGDLVRPLLGGATHQRATVLVSQQVTEASGRRVHRVIDRACARGGDPRSTR
jgi:hypothetical protein